jgi:hypothetical protein
MLNDYVNSVSRDRIIYIDIDIFIVCDIHNCRLNVIV